MESRLPGSPRASITSAPAAARAARKASCSRMSKGKSGAARQPSRYHESTSSSTGALTKILIRVHPAQSPGSWSPGLHPRWPAAAGTGGPSIPRRRRASRAMSSKIAASRDRDRHEPDLMGGGLQPFAPTPHAGTGLTRPSSGCCRLPAGSASCARRPRSASGSMSRTDVTMGRDGGDDRRGGATGAAWRARPRGPRPPRPRARARRSFPRCPSSGRRGRAFPSSSRDGKACRT